MAYSNVADLLVGDMSIGGSVNKQSFVDGAAEEMDAKLGFVYALPLTPLAPAVALPKHETLLLKTINNKLASGELIMALAIGGEDSSLHAYGNRLVTEAKMELLMIANGVIVLSAVHLDEAAVTDESNRVPSIENYDEESAVTMFENTFLRGEPSYWIPGAV